MLLLAVSLGFVIAHPRICTQLFHCSVFTLNLLRTCDVHAVESRRKEVPWKGTLLAVYEFVKLPTAAFFQIS